LVLQEGRKNVNILARSGVIWWDGPNARTMRTWIRIIVIAAAGMAAAVPVRAEISADLAKNCRAMMAKAHRRKCTAQAARLRYSVTISGNASIGREPPATGSITRGDEEIR